MKSLTEVFFAILSLALIIMCLPQIIGFGLLCAAIYYIISFASGFKDGLGR